MILVGKPHKAGATQELDGTDKSTGIQYLAEEDGTALLNAIDGLPFNNPDGAAGSVAGVPSFLGGTPNGSPVASRNTSGKGVIHKTGVSSAPKSNPFPAPGASQTRTRPVTIVE